MANDIHLAYLGNDLLVTPFFEADEWDTLDLHTAPAGAVYRDESVDLAAARGVESLQQALILRLLTPLDSLRDLGHANYGSRLHELIGRENTPAARLQARAFVIQAIAQESRVQEIVSLDILPPTADAPHSLRIHVRVRAQGSDAAIGVALEVAV